MLVGGQFITLFQTFLSVDQFTFFLIVAVTLTFILYYLLLYNMELRMEIFIGGMVDKFGKSVYQVSGHFGLTSD